MDKTLAGNMKHISSNGKFLYPVKQLSTVFRCKLMENTKRHLEKEQLAAQYRSLINTDWKMQWNVHCEPS